jgi:hypothetical protein
VIDDDLRLRHAVMRLAGLLKMPVDLFRPAFFIGAVYLFEGGAVIPSAMMMRDCRGI